MTIFGKFVLGGLGLIVATGIYYGLSSSVNDDEGSLLVSATTSLQDLESATTTASTTSDLTASSTEKKMAFPEVLSRGGDYKCSITQVMGTITSNGTVYLHKALVRAEFSTSVMGKQINSTLIARDGYMYSWTDAATSTGTKTKMPMIDSKGNATSTPGVRTWNGDQVKEYTCDAWAPDEKLFEIPTTITFKTQ